MCCEVSEDLKRSKKIVFYVFILIFEVFEKSEKKQHFSAFRPQNVDRLGVNHVSHPKKQHFSEVQIFIYIWYIYHYRVLFEF